MSYDFVISFRKDDSFVEQDGVRRPLTDFPELQVSRYDREIVGLLEINYKTGWVTVGPPAPYQWWISNPDTPEGIEWQETTSNVRIEGFPPLGTLYCTGFDPRLARWKEIRAVKKPEPVVVAKAKPVLIIPVLSPDAAAEERRRIIEGLPAIKPTEPMPVAVVSGEDWLDQMESL